MANRKTVQMLAFNVFALLIYYKLYFQFSKGTKVYLNLYYCSFLSISLFLCMPVYPSIYLSNILALSDCLEIVLFCLNFLNFWQGAAAQAQGCGVGRQTGGRESIQRHWRSITTVKVGQDIHYTQFKVKAIVSVGLSLHWHLINTSSVKVRFSYISQGHDMPF